jgi:hypothetical protein
MIDVCRYAVYTATTPSLYHLDMIYKACVAVLLSQLISARGEEHNSSDEKLNKHVDTL